MRENRAAASDAPPMEWFDLSSEFTECYRSALRLPYYLILRSRLDTGTDGVYRARFSPVEGESEHAPERFVNLDAARAWCERHRSGRAGIA